MAAKGEGEGGEGEEGENPEANPDIEKQSEKSAKKSEQEDPDGSQAEGEAESVDEEALIPTEPPKKERKLYDHHPYSELDYAKRDPTEEF